jgi:CDP-diglyceride synthetase
MNLIKKVWAIIKALKAGTYDKATEAILPVVLESETVAPFLEKNKTWVGFLLTVAAIALEQGLIFFPGAAWIAPTLLVIGVIIQALGIAHRGVKERRLTVVDGVEVLPKEG